MHQHFTFLTLIKNQTISTGIFPPKKEKYLKLFSFLKKEEKTLNNSYRLIIYVDLFKACDCLDHDILLSKLKFYGLSNDTINLLEKYISRRDQFVQIGSIKSEHHVFSCRIPQGSVMGPLLFNILINDLKFILERE